MATRPVFCKTNHYPYVEKKNIDFTWFPGFAPSQKMKSIESLHENYIHIYPESKILEISSKSTEKLGVQLSAFNLKVNFLELGKSFILECVFQSSKVFNNGGPYIDLLYKSPIDAKRDPRLKVSGDLIHFNVLGEVWPNDPPTLFYDWLYMKAVYSNKNLMNDIVKYDAFTDIEFNPSKSINCQAKSAALFVSLYQKGLLEEVLSEPQKFIEIFNRKTVNNAENKEDEGNIQLTLF